MSLSRLRLTDVNLFAYDPTTLVLEVEQMDGQEVIQLALYDSPELEGIGIFLTEDRVLKLKRWIDQYLGVRDGSNP
jgi:hypothetical protein